MAETPYITPGAASKEAKCSRQAIYLAIKAKQLRGCTSDGRILIHRATFRRWMQDREKRAQTDKRIRISVN